MLLKHHPSVVHPNKISYHPRRTPSHIAIESHFVSACSPQLDTVHHNPLSPNMQEVKGNIDKLRSPVDSALSHRDKVVPGAWPLEGQRIQETAGLLSLNWDKLNKLYQDRQK